MIECEADCSRAASAVVVFENPRPARFSVCDIHTTIALQNGAHVELSAN